MAKLSPFNLRAWLALRSQKRRRRNWTPPPLPPVPVIANVTPIYGGSHAGQFDLQVDFTVGPYSPGNIDIYLHRPDDPADDYTLQATLPSTVTEVTMSRVGGIPAPGVVAIYRVKMRFYTETEQSACSIPFEVTVQAP